MSEEAVRSAELGPTASAEGGDPGNALLQPPPELVPCLAPVPELEGE